MQKLSSFILLIITFGSFVFLLPIQTVNADVGACVPDGRDCPTSGAQSCCSGACNNGKCGSCQAGSSCNPNGGGPAAGGGLQCQKNSDCPVGYVCGNSNSCVQYSPPTPPPNCNTLGSDGSCIGVDTALGPNMSPVPSLFIARIFGILIGIAGGVAVILIMIAGYRFMMSQGKPESIQQAREQLIAAIVGLFFLIFSLVILEVIGIDILRIPGATNSGPGGSPSGNNSCSNVSNASCIPSNLCHGNGGTSVGALDCAAGQVCCQF